MVRACLAMDPLARPQSVFALQKVLQAAPAAAEPAAAPAGRPTGWRGLVGRISAFGRGSGGA
jgi:hypothetical protein